LLRTVIVVDAEELILLLFAANLNCGEEEEKENKDSVAYNLSLFV
jgi:hypothetical protein